MNRHRDQGRTAPVPPHTSSRFNVSMPVLAGAVLGLALAASWTVSRASRQPLRRYADHAPERRSPLSLFIAGGHPRRRQIDRSSSHPLFERRQEVYEAY